jgi:hypothetical protein
MQIFSYLASTQTDLENFLTVFQVNSKENNQTKRQKDILPKFKPTSIFTKISKLILFFFTPEFALEISKL